jgi:hypothetical protein
MFYVSIGSFDTHAAQAPAQQPLLIYVADAQHGFTDDLERLSRADGFHRIQATGEREPEQRSRSEDGYSDIHNR